MSAKELVVVMGKGKFQLGTSCSVCVCLFICKLYVLKHNESTYVSLSLAFLPARHMLQRPAGDTLAAAGVARQRHCWR